MVFAASAHAKDLDEMVHLTLQESYCLPILAYAAAAVKYRLLPARKMS